MNAFLWVSSSLIMLMLLVLLMLRAFEELLGIRLLDILRGRVDMKRLCPTTWSKPVVFAVSLAVLWIGAFLGYKLAGASDGFLHHFWSRFTEAGDAIHYTYIASNGYATSGDEINKIVFFPLYPLLQGILGWLIGFHMELAGIIVSQVCYGLSAVVLLELAKLDTKHPSTVLLAYWLYPFGFFSLGVFSEGLFLLLTILGLYLLRTRSWIKAGLVGLLCALTRTQGVLLLFPAVYCAWKDARENGWNWRFLALIGPLVGYGIYLLINKLVCGSFFAYVGYERAAPWYQSAQWLGDTVVQQWNMARDYAGLARFIYLPQLFLYYILAALLYWGYRQRLNTEYILFGTAYLGMSYTPSWLISGARYSFGCVPIYLSLGRVDNRYARGAILLVEFIAFLTYSCYFMQGQAIM